MIFYVGTNNKYTGYKTLQDALQNTCNDDKAIIYVEEYFEDMDRGIIKTVLYENGDFLFNNVFKYY